MIEQQFMEYVVKQLVDNPDEVNVERITDERGILLKLTVSPDDIGRVIGKHGATAQSLRNLLRALGTKNNDRYNLKIIDIDKIEENNHATTENAKADKIVEKTDADIVENESDLVKETRKALADLDDLDI